ncbi:MAG: 1-deoxy-D-xylulose-5-phosphate reductoisomerase [Armatimonadota bacterium]
MADPTRIAVLGATGSIGRQTLEVVENLPELFEIVSLSCDRSVEAIVAQARRHRPKTIVLSDPAAAKAAADALAGAGIRVEAGPEAVAACARDPEADIVVAAIAGVAGLLPVWEAVKVGKRVALANKEPLVVAGGPILAEAARSGACLLPVDSEHSAVFQTLLGQDRSAIARVTLTASGGAFRDVPVGELDRVTPEQALSHPTWKMGPKVTVDSATLMNKGLELIEAHWLFGLDPARLDIVLHRESIVHSMVQFADGAIIAHLAQPDMRIPIQFALTFPRRLPRSEPPPELASLGTLHFEPFEQDRWPCVRLAREAMATGGTAPAALNAADEVAVAWFLEGRIPFPDIPRVVEGALCAHQPGAGDSLDQLIEADRSTRLWLQGKGPF